MLLEDRPCTELCKNTEQTIMMTLTQNDAQLQELKVMMTSVLARIEKFSNLPVINFFFTVIRTKDQLFVRGIWGDKMREKARKSAV